MTGTIFMNPQRTYISVAMQKKTILNRKCVKNGLNSL